MHAYPNSVSLTHLCTPSARPTRVRPCCSSPCCCLSPLLYLNLRREDLVVQDHRGPIARLMTRLSGRRLRGNQQGPGRFAQPMNSTPSNPIPANLRPYILHPTPHITPTTNPGRPDEQGSGRSLQSIIGDVSEGLWVDLSLGNEAGADSCSDSDLTADSSSSDGSEQCAGKDAVARVLRWGAASLSDAAADEEVSVATLRGFACFGGAEARALRRSRRCP